jgi:hypothetical protein
MGSTKTNTGTKLSSGQLKQLRQQAGTYGPATPTHLKNKKKLNANASAKTNTGVKAKGNAKVTPSSSKNATATKNTGSSAASSGGVIETIVDAAKKAHDYVFGPVTKTANGEKLPGSKNKLGGGVGYY